MGNQLSIFAAAFATRVARICGRQIPWFSFGRQRRESAARVCCMSCKSTRSTSTSAWSSSGRGFRKPAKKRSRSRNCCRIRPDSARSIDESMCSTTAQSFARLKNKNRCGRPEPRMVITPALSVFSSMNSSAVSLGNRWQNIGERFLANLSNLIFGLVCQKERIRGLRRCTPQKGASRRSRNNFMSI